MDTINFGRLRAMANQSRLNGGEGKQKLLDELLDLERPLMKLVDEIRSVRLQAQTPACRVKDGFSVPEVSCRCGAKAVPFAFFDGEEVSTSMPLFELPRGRSASRLALHRKEGVLGRL